MKGTALLISGLALIVVGIAGLVLLGSRLVSLTTVDSAPEARGEQAATL